MRRVMALTTACLFILDLSAAVSIRKRIGKGSLVKNGTDGKGYGRHEESSSTSFGSEMSSRNDAPTHGERSQLYWDTIEAKRRQNVEVLKRRYQGLRKSVLHKDPLSFTTEEKHEVALFRLQLNAQMTNFRRKKGPAESAYIDDLVQELQSIRDSLTRQSQYKDAESKSADWKASRANMGIRWRTRRKAREHGVDIKVQKGRKALDDGAPLRLQQQRSYSMRYARRHRKKIAMTRQHDGSTNDTTEEYLLPKAWGLKKPRSK